MEKVTVKLTEEEARMAYVAIVCWRAALEEGKKHPYFNSHNLKVLESAQEKIIKFKDEEILKDLFNFIQSK